jgi:hypothetical protein
MRHTIEFVDGDLEDDVTETIPWTDEPNDSTAVLPAVEDDEFVVPPRRRMSRLTIALLAGLALTVTFTGGALAQKDLGSSTNAAAGGVARRAGGAGAFPGGGTFPGGAAGGITGTGTGAGTTAGAAPATGGSTAATTAVIGTVVSVSGTTLTVKNLGGKTVIVHLGTDATITKSTTLTASALIAGTTVSVDGTTGSDGSITATAVTTRSTAN